MSGKHMLICGLGSAGKRHARNLASLGCRVSCVDPQEDRRTELNGELEVAGTYSSLEDALAEGGAFDGVGVMSPPAFHVEQALAALERGLPVLLEKPVCPDEASARKLQEAVKRTRVPLLLTYTWRWWPPIAKVRELLESRAVGQLRHAEFVMSAHLADWHPWEDYRSWFMASRSQGGGALLDESHWIDLMLWFFGTPRNVFARIEKISDLEIETDDNVDMMVSYEDGLRVLLHLDLYGRPHQRYIRFIGEEGSILWTADPNRVAVGREMTETWDAFDYDCERNDMFLAADREFLEVLEGRSSGSCTIEDGVRVLSLVEAARRSSSERRAVDL